MKNPSKTHHPVGQDEDAPLGADFSGEDDWLKDDDAAHGGGPHHDWTKDCGNAHFKFLSYEQALHNVNLNHPRLRNHLEYEYSNRAYRLWPLHSEFGWHHFDPTEIPISGLYCIIILAVIVIIIATFMAVTAGGDASVPAVMMVLGGLLIAIACTYSAIIGVSDIGHHHNIAQHADTSGAEGRLSQYGAGVILYFKMTKFMACVFIIQGLFTLPSILMFSSGSETNINFLKPLEKLGMITLGSVGEVTRVCATLAADADGKGNLQLSCARGELRGLRAFYGTPTGACGCPLEQTPTNHHCGEEDDRFGGFVSFLSDTLNATLSPSALVSRLHRGYEPVLHQTFTHIPKADPTCDSSTAQQIIQLCEGKHSCLLKLDAEYLVQGENKTKYKVTFRGGIADSSSNATTMTTTTATSEAAMTSMTLPLACKGRERVIVTAQCYSPSMQIEGMEVDKQTVADVVLAADFIACIVFWSMTHWLNKQENTEQQWFDAGSVACDDYTVLCERLPKHENTVELSKSLTKHLNTILNTEGVKNKAAKRRGQEAGEKKVQVNAIHYGYAAHRILNAQKARWFLMEKLEQAEHRLQASMDLHRDHLHAHNSGPRTEKGKSDHSVHLNKQEKLQKKLRKRVAQAKLRIKKVDDRILKLVKELDSDKTDDDIDVQAACAFVTFESEEGYLRCLDTFINDRYTMLHWFKRKELRLGGTSLNFREAPPPGEVVWEHIVMPVYELIPRRIFTKLVLLGILCLSWTLQHTCRQVKTEIGYTYPTGSCPRGMDDALAVGDPGDAPSAVLRGAGYGDGAAGGGGSNSSNSSSNSSNSSSGSGSGSGSGSSSGSGNSSSRTLRMLRGWGRGSGRHSALGGRILINITGVSDMEKKQAEEEELMALQEQVVGEGALATAADYRIMVEQGYALDEFKPTVLLDCYCRAGKRYSEKFFTQQTPYVNLGPLDKSAANATTSSATSGADLLLIPESERNATLCRRWAHHAVKSEGMTAAIVTVVLLTNSLLGVVSMPLARFDCHAYVSAELIDAARKCFYCSLVNTLVFPLMIHMDPTVVGGGGILSFLDGDHADTTKEWYFDVGALVTLLMCLNSVLPHLPLALHKPWHFIQICWDRHGKVWDHTTTRRMTQHDLNTLFLGQQLPIAARHAQALLVTFVCHALSAAIPVLHWVAALNFVVLYIVDSWAFLRFYQTPPAYTGQLAEACSSMLPWATLIHCLMAAWMLGNKDMIQEPLGADATGLRAYGASSMPTMPRMPSVGGSVNVSALASGSALSFSDPTQSGFGEVLSERFFNSIDGVYAYVMLSIVLAVWLVLRATVLEDLIVLYKAIKGDVPEWEHNPDYYEVLPDHVLEEIKEDPGQWRHAGVVIDHDNNKLVQLATRTLEGRKKKAEEEKKSKQKKSRLDTSDGHRVMIGLYSYDMKINPRYEFVAEEDAEELRKMIEAERDKTLDQIRRSSFAGLVKHDSKPGAKVRDITPSKIKEKKPASTTI